MGEKFNARKFAAKKCAMGLDCFVYTTQGDYKYGGTHPLAGKSWEKDTVYLQKEDGTFLEYVKGSTGSWYKVSEEMSDVLNRLH